MIRVVRNPLPATVLVVEDDPSMVTALRDGLQSHGVALETTSDVDTAKRLLGENQYCCLVLDLVLERGGSGFDVLHHLNKANVDVATVVVTSKLPDYIREMLDATRVKLVFPKPLDARLLSTVIAALCEKATS